jgi:starch phosphorylase
VRDVLSKRWSLTSATYHRKNPKRIYYLSMEFLIGRSLTNNITNLMLDRYVEGAAREANLDWLGLLEQEARRRPRQRRSRAARRLLPRFAKGFPTR